MTSNQISFWNYQELVRSNRVKEAETERANRTKEVETERSNREQERIAYDRYLEEVRSNKANEAIRWADVGEAQRHNKEQEAIGWVQAQMYEANANKAWADVTYTTAKTNTEYAITQTRKAEAKVASEVAGLNVQLMQSQVVHNYASSVGSVLSGASNIAKMVLAW